MSNESPPSVIPFPSPSPPPVLPSILPSIPFSPSASFHSLPCPPSPHPTSLLTPPPGPDQDHLLLFLPLPIDKPLFGSSSWNPRCAATFLMSSSCHGISIACRAASICLCSCGQFLSRREAAVLKRWYSCSYVSTRNSVVLKSGLTRHTHQGSAARPWLDRQALAVASQSSLMNSRASLGEESGRFYLFFKTLVAEFPIPPP